MKESAILARLRRVCLGLPEVRETVKWGHPTFEAGKKIFAVLDRYDRIELATAPVREQGLAHRGYARLVVRLWTRHEPE